ncbi:hypothetical protein CGRA01v4_14479 [Colletotrichum graminicola]|nr:hypothetical protein CGRA01v4_14479 [Colletotrichum graminicola]
MRVRYLDGRDHYQSPRHSMDRSIVNQVCGRSHWAASHFSVCLRVFAMPIYCLGADPVMAASRCGHLASCTRGFLQDFSNLCSRLVHILIFAPVRNARVPIFVTSPIRLRLSPLRKSAPARGPSQALTGTRGCVSWGDIHQPGRQQHWNTGGDHCLGQPYWQRNQGPLNTTSRVLDHCRPHQHMDCRCGACWAASFPSFLVFNTQSPKILRISCFLADRRRCGSVSFSFFFQFPRKRAVLPGVEPCSSGLSCRRRRWQSNRPCPAISFLGLFFIVFSCRCCLDGTGEPLPLLTYAIFHLGYQYVCGASDERTSVDDVACADCQELIPRPSSSRLGWASAMTSNLLAPASPSRSETAL